jgi:hypothetical protein
LAYGVIQFVEAGRRVATLVRVDDGQPTGKDGVMDVLSAFIEETAPRMLRQGSPGALYMAELFTAREVQAGRPIRVLGGQGALGISVDEVRALTGEGYFYDVNIGPEGDRGPPTLHMTPLSGPPRRV